MKINYYLRKIYHNVFFRSRLFSSLIFRANFTVRHKDAYYFDITTLVLLKVLQKNIKKNDTLLDLGTGTSALIAIEIKKKIGCKVIASDINKNICILARKNIKFNNLKIKVYQSNFFKNIYQNFNIVSFNPPYVATSLGKKISLSKKFKCQWDGGKNSDKVIMSFLKKLKKYNKRIICYMGINRQHLDTKTIEQLIKKNKLNLIEVKKSHLFPVNVYVIKNK